METVVTVRNHVMANEKSKIVLYNAEMLSFTSTFQHYNVTHEFEIHGPPFNNCLTYYEFKTKSSLIFKVCTIRGEIQRYCPEQYWGILKGDHFLDKKDALSIQFLEKLYTARRRRKYALIHSVIHQHFDLFPYFMELLMTYLYTPKYVYQFIK